MYACDGSNRTIQRDGYFIEGNISRDTVYNGLIRFFTTKFHTLETEANYREGKLHGRSVDYYKNGQERMISSYENGKINGYAYYFLEDGTLSERIFYYHGLYFGPHTSYKNGKPYYYKFLSLEGQELFGFEYDYEKKVVKKHSEDAFFFYYPRVLDIYGDEVAKTMYLVYLPNPPYFRFKYDLVITDSAYNIYYQRPLVDSIGFMNVVLDPPLDAPTKFHALRLNIYDSTDHSEVLMFKKLSEKGN